MHYELSTNLISAADGFADLILKLMNICSGSGFAVSICSFWAMFRSIEYN
jgi:hypothetical protein